jgi:hypothetical protein
MDQELLRLQQIIGHYADIRRDWRWVEVVSNSLWSSSGESYITVLIDGDYQLAVYRDGPRPDVGSHLQVQRMQAEVGSYWLALPLPTTNPTCLDDVFLVSARGPAGDVILRMDAGDRDPLVIYMRSSTPPGNSAPVSVATYNSYPYDPYTSPFPGDNDSAIGSVSWSIVSSSPVAGYAVRPLVLLARYTDHTTPFNGISPGGSYPSALAGRYFTYGYDLAHTTGSALYYSDDGGTTWVAATGLIGCLHISDGSSSFGPPSLNYGYMVAVGDNGAFLYESKDYGATWVQVPNSAPYDGSLWRYTLASYNTLVARDSLGDSAHYWNPTDGSFLRPGSRYYDNYTFYGVTTSGEVRSNCRFQNFYWSQVIDPAMSDVDLSGGGGHAPTRVVGLNGNVWYNAEHWTQAGTFPTWNVNPAIEDHAYRDQYGPVGPGATTMISWLGTEYGARYSATVTNDGGWQAQATINPLTGDRYYDTDTYLPPYSFAQPNLSGLLVPEAGDTESWTCEGNWNLASPGPLQFGWVLNGNPKGGVAIYPPYLAFWAGFNDARGTSGTYDYEVRAFAYAGTCVLVGTANEAAAFQLARVVGGYTYFAPGYPGTGADDTFTSVLGVDPARWHYPEDGDFWRRARMLRHPGFGTPSFENLTAAMVAQLGGVYTASRAGIAAGIV